MIRRRALASSCRVTAAEAWHATVRSLPPLSSLAGVSAPSAEPSIGARSRSAVSGDLCKRIRAIRLHTLTQIHAGFGALRSPAGATVTASEPTDRCCNASRRAWSRRPNIASRHSVAEGNSRVAAHGRLARGRLRSSRRRGSVDLCPVSPSSLSRAGLRDLRFGARGVRAGSRCGGTGGPVSSMVDSSVDSL